MQYNKDKLFSELKNIASLKGGECLSPEYYNAFTKLEWRCANGHIWKAVPNNIKRGKWCPKCANQLNAEKRKLTIHEMNVIAKKKGGKCLSKEYVSARTHLTWQCKEGHVWNAKPNNIKSGHWCPECAANKKLELSEMQQIAINRGGKCLSKSYINLKTKLTWQCGKGHIWDARPYNIKTGTWCPQCAKLASKISKIDIKEMQRIASVKQGLCLSNEYIDAKTHLKWQCKEGHVWSAKPSNIKTGHWCPECAENKKLDLKEMQQIAKGYEGECLSIEYINAFTKLKWKCKENHIWDAIPNSIKNGTWCPVCANNQKLDISEMYEIAKNRGGKCLSSEYQNSATKLKWECLNGHHWEATPMTIKKGSWCPKCLNHLGESICRAFFESIFKRDFPKSRPTWLRNSNNHQLELDGYCESLKLAFEHQGRQHYRRIKRFFYSNEKFARNVENDREKREQCKNNNVILIEVPEIPELLPVSDVLQFIKNECLKQYVDLPQNFENITVNLTRIYIPETNIRLNEVKELAIKRRGVCLSKTYLGSKEKLLFTCSHSHKFYLAPIELKKGKWCPLCRKGNLSKKEIQQYEKLASTRGGSCLSSTYINSSTKLKWQCKLGHIWEASPTNIKLGSWCPICKENSKISILDMKQFAQKRNGKCLSVKYFNARTKLTWQCSLGHIWEAVPDSIRRGSWCPQCANNKKGKRSSIK